LKVTPEVLTVTVLYGLAFTVDDTAADAGVPSTFAGFVSETIPLVKTTLGVSGRLYEPR
jgi:hypothetical protein